MPGMVLEGGKHLSKKEKRELECGGQQDGREGESVTEYRSERGMCGREWYVCG